MSTFANAIERSVAKKLGIPDHVFRAWGLTSSFYDCVVEVELELVAESSFLVAEAVSLCQTQHADG